MITDECSIPEMRIWSILLIQSEEQDKSSDFEQQPPFGDRKISSGLCNLVEVSV